MIEINNINKSHTLDKDGIVVLSLCDGMSCGQIAFERANIKVKKYFASEIKDISIKVTKDNYPNTIHIGDVNKITYRNGILHTEIDDFMGQGRWTRGNAEICLLCTKGKPKRIAADVRQIIYAPIGEHSEKPNEARERIIKLVGDVPRIELFARQEASGWDCWGDEV